MAIRKPSPEIFAALVAILVSACSYNSKVLYEAPDSHAGTEKEASADQDSIVSGLHRLALLPVTMKVSPENTDFCMDPCEPERDRGEMALHAHRYLESELGYEIICLDFACRRERENPFTDKQLSNWAAEFSAWADEHEDDMQLPREMVDITRRISEAFGVDGIMVIHGDIRYIQYADMIHWLVTLTASAYYSLARGNEADLHIEIFDARDGTKLWGSETTVMQIGTPVAPQANGSRNYGPVFFGGLDPSRESK
jgi:hypothetical protein